MKKEEITPKMQRQRKFMLMLPILVLPFLTLAFWALGGGKMEAAEAASLETKGFNLNLPGANLPEGKPMNKMSYYEQAQKDSTRLGEQKRNDQANLSKPGQEAFGNPFKDNATTRGLNTSIGGGYGNDPKTENIYRKLELLNKELNKPATIPAAGSTSVTTPRGGTATGRTDAEKLEKMMQAMNEPGKPDPELAQLNSMLEKIMDIQNPGRVKEQLDRAKEQKQELAYKVEAVSDAAVTLLDNNLYYQNMGNGFYGLDDTTNDTTTQNAIPAVIHETQTLVNGAIVKLRLQEAISVNGIKIPKDSFIFGVASISGERLNVEITSIRYGNSIFPVTLQVFDMDGLDGIHIPGAIARDVATNSADRSVQGIGLSSLDPTWQGQAASAGIETAKTLFSKKVKLVKVTVKAGYQVLLRDSKQQQATVQPDNQH
ncbi:conjugative transposon protein TraM [Flavobacterium sp. Sd200]|uniref:conjugative transposon protein TraM n=1 Tax=Flavobacterium sp. Sd200 TaxID=2692211 RepID=UPI0013704E2A|nr:conjugative transposon protein TraM [Flavobacterium sp. Sd200]MXN91169.1 conjugative transposon protein TraM [Flavobacterium sp. Sd200]